MAYKRFENLIAWQKARVLTRTIYELTREGAFAKDYGLGNQMQRAAVSTMSNIAEGFERSSKREFHRFLAMAKASCAEVRCQLYVALDAKLVTDVEFDAISGQATEISRLNQWSSGLDSQTDA